MSTCSSDWNSRLQDLIESNDWVGTLSRIYSHPHEVSVRGPQDRRALHIACEQDAPAPIIQALLATFPQASSMVGTSRMNPLHITCSSSHASAEVVQILLENGSSLDTNMQDVDGDTALHTACRCGAPLDVLTMLLRSNPNVVLLRDNESLTPLLRLWVRYYVILGSDVIDAVSAKEDITGDLVEGWEKTKILLRTAYHGAVDIQPDTEFLTVHAAAAIDCPRAALKIAIILHTEELEKADKDGKLPLHIAIAAPVYKVHDLSEDGYDMNRIYDNYDDECQNNDDDDTDEIDCPSVIDVLIEANPRPSRTPDAAGRLPLNLALAFGKSWKEGVRAILGAYPEALSLPDSQTGLYSFMLAAEKGASLCTIFELIKANPELVRGGIKQHSK